MPKFIINSDANAPLSGDDAKHFFDFVNAQHKEALFLKKGAECAIKDNTYVFDVDALFQSEGDTYKAYFVPYVMNKVGDDTATLEYGPKLLGRGAMGMVFEAISFRLTPTFLKKIDDGKPQVLKMQSPCACDAEIKSATCTKHFSRTMIEKELEFTQAAGQLTVQPLAWIHSEETDKLTNYMVMDKAPGRELFDILGEDSEKIAILSLHDRMEFSNNLLAAVLQFSQEGIVHHDLRTVNVMADINTHTVKVIDFGLAGKDKELTHRRRGSLPYLPKELVEAIFHKREYIQTTKIDVFAAARMLVELWGGADNSFDLEDPTRFDRNLRTYKAYLTGHTFSTLCDLFKRIPTADRQTLSDAKLLDPIKKLLKQMLDNDPEERLSMQEAVSKFSEIYREYTSVVSEPPVVSELTQRSIRSSIESGITFFLPSPSLSNATPPRESPSSPAPLSSVKEGDAWLAERLAQETPSPSVADEATLMASGF